MNAFVRSAGSAVGVAVFGAISNAVIAQGVGPDDPGTIIPHPSGRSWLSP